jgi:hypothetical protein
LNLLKPSFKSKLDIAVDDISFNEGACPISTECDFESIDICGYANDINSDYLWNRTEGTAEFGDKTFGLLGHYMSAPSLAPHSKGKTARLLSPSYPAKELCVNFFYKTIGDIEFNVRTYAFGIYGKDSAFNAVGNRGKDWLRGQATLKYTTGFQIVFEAVDLGEDFKDGNVMLDEINVSYKSCQPLGTCNFEDDLCGFSLSDQGDFSWLRIDGELGQGENINVPSVDHTTGTIQGFFMYLYTDGIDENQRAFLNSEAITEETGYQCLEYYINTNKENTASMNIIRKNLRTEERVTVDEFTGYAGEGWSYREVQLPSSNYSEYSVDYPYIFIVEGVVGKSKGRLAFDDIKLSNKQCQGPPPKPGDFNCLNGQFVSSDSVCNFINDCSNGEDERYCGTCDFEVKDGVDSAPVAHQCGWVDKSIGNYRWFRLNNGTPYNYTGPGFDHTFYNSTGIHSSFKFHLVSSFFFKFILF